MRTHRLQDKAGRWHRVSKSSSKPGAYVSYSGGEPSRLWFPAQFTKVLPPWPPGTRLDFLLDTGEIQEAVSYRGLGLNNVVAWRFSKVPDPLLPAYDHHD